MTLSSAAALAQDADDGMAADEPAAEQVSTDDPVDPELSAQEVLDDSEEVAGPPLPPECEPDPLNNTIIVCAPRNDAEFRIQDGFDPATVSQRGEVPSAPNVFGIPNHGIAIPLGGAPEPVLLIDLEDIPEAPPGSDADRVARGLAPRGNDDGSGQSPITAEPDARPQN